MFSDGVKCVSNIFNLVKNSFDSRWFGNTNASRLEERHCNHLRCECMCRAWHRDTLVIIKGTQHAAYSGHTGQFFFKLKKTIEIQQSGQLRYVVKYKVRIMAKSLLKHHCYCPMLLMRTTKTAVRLQTKGIFHHLYRF